MRFRVEDLELWAADLLSAAGVPRASANAAAEVYALASLRGLGHHDLSYLPQRLGWLTSGHVKPDPAITLVSSSPATEVWDGGEGLGEVLCHHITRRALALARVQGLGYAAVRRSNHFLAAAPYTELGAREGFLVLIWSNTDAGMGFPGGTARQIGNNPLGWGIGTGAGGLSADLSLAYSSLGNLNALVAAGQTVPLHWGLDPSGQATDQPSALLAGAVGPIAGPKGLALALLGEVVTGVLAGGTTLDQIAPGGGLNTHNQMVLAWDLSAFGGREAVEARVASLKQRAKALDSWGRLPGERSREAAHDGREHGLVLADTAYEALHAWSARWGVAVPAALQQRSE